ncbi:MAG: transposase, partial [Gammaproteobacteria bacterium]|nr:transposase [Gammaproteobacteria bacterium]
TDKLLSLVGDWQHYLKGAKEQMECSGKEFESHERTGRPLGEESFLEKAERLLHRELKKKKPGPKGKVDNN